ncbi:MAG: cation:proton antiporter [Victivallaceae bacterium]|nr:cation:proton antiporter [Victivallaceae bacterium]
MEQFTPGLLFIIGLGVFGGMLGAWFFQKIKCPQVIGYIAIGLLLGETGFKFIRQVDIVNLKMFNLFALGIIGFLVGGELKIAIFKKYAKQFTAILLGEGVLAFLLVGGSSFFIVHLITGNFAASLAAGVVFGAIASATDPASTIDVLWEYRSKGTMTSAVIAIVALDDVLAMTLYGLGTSAAQLLVSKSGSLGTALGHISIELFGALAMGAVASLILTAFLRWVPQAERGAAMSIGIILLLISLAAYYGMDVILASMMLGFMLSNLAPRRSEELFKLMRNFSVPIYVLFFVLVGARLAIGSMPVWLWGLVAVYVVGRSAGKMLGAYLGAKVTGSEPVIRKYLGMSLFAQGGVAIGLSIMAAEHLGNVTITESMSLGEMIIFVVTSTTLCVQVIGPPMVKLAIKLAGEAGKDITEADVMATMLVSDVVDDKLITITEGDSISKAVKFFTEHDMLICPVLDSEKRLSGVLTFDALKDVLIDRNTWDWLLVADIMKSADDCSTGNDSLKTVYERMQRLKIDQMPVLAGDKNRQVLGILDIRKIRTRVHAEMLNRGISLEEGVTA